MQELTNKQKLEVLKETLRYYDGYCLCNVIAHEAYLMDYIEVGEYDRYSNSSISNSLIPELLQFKPEGKRNGESWFGPTERPGSTAKRTQVLKDLIEMIR
jgi:hypothetical protein